MLGRLLLAAAMAAAAGCVVPLPVPPAPFSRNLTPTEGWARVLRTRVDPQGRVDFPGIFADPSDLDDFIAYVARVSPVSHPGLFPTPESRLAYNLNAYDAWVLKAAVSSGVLPEQKLSFFLRLRATVGGRKLSPRALETAATWGSGERRALFALSDMTRSGPRLPPEPFDAGRLGAQLDRAAREFLNDDRNVSVDAEAGVVRLSRRLKRMRQLYPAKGFSLIEYVNRFRAMPVPAGLQAEFLPYDWSLNRQPDPSVR